jgi:hypothetical protein
MITQATFEVPPLGYSVPICPRSGWSAPQKPSDTAGFGTQVLSVEDAIGKFCDENDGRVITNEPGKDVKYTMEHVQYWSYWISANVWNNGPPDNQCTGKEIIHRNECVDRLTRIMDRCNPVSISTTGGSYPGLCIYYVSITE